MSGMQTDDPYRVAAASMTTMRTPRGYTALQCLLRASTVSFLCGCLGGLGVFVMLSGSYFAIGTLLIPLGVSFGLALVLSLHLFVGELSHWRMVAMLASCFVAFVVGDYANQTRLGIEDVPFLKPIRWYVVGPLAAASIIVPTIRLVAGAVPRRMLWFVWATILACGSVVSLAFERLPLPPPLVAGLGVCLFQTTTVALTCWLFALVKGTPDESERAAAHREGRA